MKILCIGESLLEITLPMNYGLIEGAQYNFIEKYENGGGHAGNTAYLLGKWGCEVYIASMVGADDAANKIKKEYEMIGVTTDFIETSYDKGTTITTVILNTQSKNNTIFKADSNSKLKKYAFTIEPNVIVADGYEFNASVTAFEKFTNAKKILLAVTNNNDTMELCRYSNYAIFNMNTAENVAGLQIDFNNTATIVNVYNRIKQKFPNLELIITLGEKGCVYSINNQIKIMPSAKIELIDPNGTFDTFSGAFVYAITKNFDLERSIIYATIAGSLSTAKITGRNSIPALIEVTNYYESKFGVQNTQNMNANQNTNQVNMNTEIQNKIQQNNNIPVQEVANNDNGQNS